MDFLLDTHVLLWWDQGDARLPAQVRREIADADDRVFVSGVSPWEIAIKSRKGKLRFTGSSVVLTGANGFLPLAIGPVPAEAADILDWSHRDPFDRVLVDQAQRWS